MCKGPEAETHLTQLERQEEGQCGWSKAGKGRTVGRHQRNGGLGRTDLESPQKDLTLNMNDMGSQ